MSKKPITGLSAAMLGTAEPEPPPAPIARPKPVPAPAAASSAAELIALTLKVSPEIYERLKLLGVRRRKSNQAILSEALAQYLDREGQ